MDTIREAVKGMIKNHKAERLAKMLGDLNPSTIYKWSEPSTEMDRHSEIPLRRVVQLTLATKDTTLMEAIAAEAGGVFVPGPHLVEGRFESERAALQVLKDAAELIGDYTKAIEDGKVTPAEYKELAREAMQLHLAAAAIVESAKEKAGI